MVIHYLQDLILKSIMVLIQGNVALYMLFFQCIFLALKFVKSVFLWHCLYGAHTKSIVILIAVCLFSDTSDEIEPALFTSSTPKAT